ncbi:MAG TPA: ATP phosphoribosyltransferase regulatory subunit [Pyrinomonadaceae bacterium]|nr:ATP phosphoribosyltransferase regulatory subunit [Pyrinomonadaceae bacterium]
MTSRIPAGMRYYIGAEARLRRTVEDVAMSVFQAWNYEEVITPSVDYYDLFEQGMGQREAQRGFRFTDNDGRLLALRPDVTSSVARMAATLLSERPRPLRFCYAAPVFRQQTQSHAEWRRENTQLGCELIGTGGKPADLEVLRLAAEILSRLNLQSRYCITINNVEIFNGVAAHLKLEERAREQLRRLIDTRETAELQRFLKNYPEAHAFSQPSQLTGKRNVIQAARNSITNTRSLAALDSLADLWTEIESLGFENSFEIDLGDVSSLDYYTGLSLKIFVHGAGVSVGRGGRYDGLTGSFGRAEPAVGFVLNLDALTEVLGRSSRNIGQER